MELHLVGLDAELIAAWQQAFPIPRCTFSRPISLPWLTIPCFSPANSCGYKDGSIDRQYTEFFGFQLQEGLQRAILARPEGYLPVSASVLVPTGHPRIPYLIAAPTMETPGPVPPAHAFYAMIAVLTAAHRHRDRVTRVFCPGLATGIGQMEPASAAQEMAPTYRRWHRLHGRREPISPAP